MILSAGNKGKRFMTPHATAMLHQPKVPNTGERQATELQIKWKEVKAQKQVLVDILTKTTGHPADKIDKVSSLGFFFTFLRHQPGHTETVVYDSKRCDRVRNCR